MDAFKDLKNLDKDTLLGALGLQTKSQTADFLLPALGLFGVGLLIGTGVGLLVAPRSGREMRRRIKQGVEGVRERAVAAIDEELGSHAPASSSSRAASR
jgi:gas vesicle protein